METVYRPPSKKTTLKSVQPNAFKKTDTFYNYNESLFPELSKNVEKKDTIKTGSYRNAISSDTCSHSKASSIGDLPKGWALLNEKGQQVQYGGPSILQQLASTIENNRVRMMLIGHHLENMRLQNEIIDACGDLRSLSQEIFEDNVNYETVIDNVYDSEIDESSSDESLYEMSD